VLNSNLGCGEGSGVGVNRFRRETLAGVSWGVGRGILQGAEIALKRVGKGKEETPPSPENRQPSRYITRNLSVTRPNEYDCRCSHAEPPTCVPRQLSTGANHEHRGRTSQDGAPNAAKQEDYIQIVGVNFDLRPELTSLAVSIRTEEASSNMRVTGARESGRTGTAGNR